jgi:hypothetical protein
MIETAGANLSAVTKQSGANVKKTYLLPPSTKLGLKGQNLVQALNCRRCSLLTKHLGSYEAKRLALS